jgi:hypothetical protein
MKVTFIEKEAQDEFVDMFKIQFSQRFGVIPEVLIEDQVLVIPSELELVGLEKVVNNFIPSHLKLKYKTFITKKRSRDLVILRMIFMMMAKDMGYSLVEIGNYTDRDHSTVIYNINTGYDLLEMDSNFQDLYMKISYIVNPKIYPDARIYKVHSETSDQCQSVGSDTLPSKYKVKRPSSSRQWGAIIGCQKRASRRPEPINPQSPDYTLGSTEPVCAAAI